MSTQTYTYTEGMEAGTKVLLHVCCAPCSCAILESMLASKLAVTVFFYNPNIHPRAEYEKRKTEVISFTRKHGIPFLDADYDDVNWFALVKGLEKEPERGKRCTACFGMRLEKTAQYAMANGFPFIATSLSISRHKNQAQVHKAGHAAVAQYPAVRFWDYNWRAKGGAERGALLAKEEGFYRQNYCGCVYSMRNKEKAD